MILASVPRSLKSENEGLRRKSQWHSTVTDSQLTQPIIGQMSQGDSSYHVSNDVSVLNPLSHLQFNETPVTMKRSSVQSDYVARSHDLSDVDVVDLMQTDPDEDNIVISLALRKDSNQNNAELTHTQGSHEYVEDALMSAAANDISIGTPKPLDLYNDFSNSDVSLQQRESDLSMRESSIWRQQADNEKFKNASSSIYEWMYSESPISAYEKAAVLIQFARDGEEHSITCTERSLQCYRLRSQYGMIFKAAAACFALLRFFERPLWTYDHGNWNDSTIYPVSHLPLLSPQATLAIKWPLAIVLLIGIALELGYKESFRWNMFENISSSRIIRYVMAIHVLFVNLSLFATVCSNFSYPELVTITSFGSLSYLLWFNRKTFQKAKIIARILPKFLLLLVLFFIVVMIFAGFGPIIFNIENVATHDDDTENFEYFGTFADSIWSVFVAITSSSYPNQVMPSYRKYREVCIYFISFITVGAFGFLNLVVVIVLVEFQKSTQLSHDTQRATRQILLMRAFEVLDEAGKGYLSRRQIKLLLNELYQHYRDFQKAGIPKESAKNILIDILDIDGDGKISLYDFSFFLDVIRIKLSLEEKGNFFTRQFPLLAKTYFFQLLIFVVEHRYIDIFVDFTTSFLLIVNILVNSRTLYYPSKISVGITLVMFVLYVIEIFCKCIAKGWKSYIHSFRNRIDFFMTSIIFLCLIAHAATHSMYSNSGYTFVVRILLFCRLILLPRNLRLLFEGRKEITKFTRLLRRVFSKITTLGIVFLCCGYVFASFGVFIYGGLIDKSTSNESLLNSTYAENGYWPLNFNDFASACMTLFCCLHVSDFDVIATGFTTTTSNWSRLYFTAWYVIGVLLLLNVVKSFFLGEFLSLFVSPKRLKALINSNTNKFNVGNRDKTSGVLLSTQQIADKHLRKRFLAVFQQSNKASGQSDYIPKHQDAMKRESATDLTQSPSMFKRDTFVMPFHYTGKSLTGMELNALEDHLSQNEENGKTSGLEEKETFASPPRIQASTANVKVRIQR